MNITVTIALVRREINDQIYAPLSKRLIIDHRIRYQLRISYWPVATPEISNFACARI